MELKVEEFITFLKLRDTREITIGRHLRCLRMLGRSLASFELAPIKGFLESSKISGISNMTLNNYISTIRLYGQTLKLAEDITRYPLFSRTQCVVRKTLSDDQIEKFLAVPYRGYMGRERHRMYTIFWSLLAMLALRPGEAARLRKTDIDLANKQIILRPEITKTGMFSTLPLFPNIFPLVKDYVENLQGEFLFPSRRGGKYCNRNEPVMSQGDWRGDFNNRLGQAGIQKVPGLVPYSLRHSCATRWINNNMSLYKVRRLMRHVKIEQTLTYEHMTSGNLVETVVKYDPLVRKTANPSDVLDTAEENLESFGLFKDPRFSEDFKKKMKDIFYDEAKRLRIKAQ